MRIEQAVTTLSFGNLTSAGRTAPDVLRPLQRLALELIDPYAARKRR
jgi:hypothetical protein